MAVHDLVLLHVDDARSLLGLRPDQASDLALEVFHPEEAESLANVLKHAFPWPVQVTTRSAIRKAYAAHFSARGGAGLLSFIPAMLALVLLIVALGAWGLQLEPDMGLMKAMGWTSGDLLQLHLTRAALMGCPAFVAGIDGCLGPLWFCPGQLGDPASFRMVRPASGAEPQWSGRSPGTNHGSGIFSIPCGQFLVRVADGSG
jgi:hypothetical protein